MKFAGDDDSGIRNVQVNEKCTKETDTKFQPWAVRLFHHPHLNSPVFCSFSIILFEFATHKGELNESESFERLHMWNNEILV